MVLPFRIGQGVSMFKKVVLGILLTVLVLTVVGWGLSVGLDRQMNSGVLAERLNDLPVPVDEMVLIDTWARDGLWGIQSREPEAGRTFVTVGSVAQGCRMLDEFYETLGIPISPTSMTGNPPDWCGRSVRAPDGHVSVWVEETESWTSIPEQFEGTENLVTIQYRAHRH